MSDWRSKPRTGKGQFYPVQEEVRQRRQRGETLRQIHDDLSNRQLISFGYDQFIKYVRKAFSAASETPPSRPTLSAAPHPFASQTAPTAPRRHTDESLHSSMPDRDRIYGTAKD